MSQITQLLQKIRKSPGMYFGWSSLSRLSGCLRGYDYALFELQAAPGDPFFLGFQGWIERRLQVKHEFWENAILKRTASEAEAFNLFWVLFDEYLADKESDEPQGNGTNPASITPIEQIPVTRHAPGGS